MKTLKKAFAILLILCLSASFQLIASAAEEPVVLSMDYATKALTVSGTIDNAYKGMLVGMMVYSADKDITSATFMPDISIMETTTSGSGKYQFPAVVFGQNAYLKIINVTVDTGSDLITKGMVIAFEDTQGTDSISGFSDAVALLSEAQIATYYNDLASFAGLTLKNADGTYSSPTYERLVDMNLDAQLAPLLKTGAAAIDTRDEYQAKIKEDMMLLAVEKFEVTDAYQALFSEFSLPVNSTNPAVLEKALTTLKGNSYTDVTALTNAINEEIKKINQQGGNPNGGVTNQFTPVRPVGGGGGGGGGAAVTPVATPVPSVTPQANGFTDLAGHWSESDVKALSDKKIINGYEDKTFRPDNGVTRAEAATIITKAFEIVASEEKGAFSDVSPEEWYYTYINDLYQAGILKGDGDAIRPQGSLTRQDMCVLIYRCLNQEGTEAELTFSDAETISDYAKEAISYLAANGIVSGYNNEFMPKDNITRGQLCAIVNRTLKAVNNQ